MPGLSHILLYVKDMAAVQNFYCHLFDYHAISLPGDRIVELVPSGDGAPFMLHPAAKSMKQGQAQAKLVFRVDDINVYFERAAELGLRFGEIHAGDGYVFSNGKDPAGNSVQITTRPMNRHEP